MLTEGNTLLSDDELEMLVILRMNRNNFMLFMRENYNHLTTDHFQRTVVDEEAGIRISRRRRQRRG